MTDAPVRIYLQWMPGEGEVTWCVGEIHEDDISYTRTDIADKRIAEMESEIEEAHESIDELVIRIAELEKYIKDHDYKTILDYMEKYLEGDME